MITALKLMITSNKKYVITILISCIIILYLQCFSLHCKEEMKIPSTKSEGKCYIPKMKTTPVSLRQKHSYPALPGKVMILYKQKKGTQPLLIRSTGTFKLCLTLCVYTVMSRLKARCCQQQDQPLNGNSALITC